MSRCGRIDAAAEAPHAVRARDGAPVSAPCTWDEIERGAVPPRSFTLRAMEDRIRDVGDLWRDLHAEPPALAPAAARLKHR